MAGFEAAFQAFMAAGGFTQPCLSEDSERARWQRMPHKSATCPHGRTPLTCETCYFNNDRGNAI